MSESELEAWRKWRVTVKVRLEAREIIKHGEIEKNLGQLRE